MAQFVLIEVNAVYLNLYKALNLQKKYLIRMIIITVIAFFLNGVIGYFWNDIIAYALATLLTAFIWLILCQIDLPEHKMAYTEWLYILLTISGCFISGYFNVWIGVIIYMGWVIIETILLFPKDIRQLIDNMK